MSHHSCSLALGLALASLLCGVSSFAVDAETRTLDPQLEPFRPLLGKTWKGEFKNSTPDKPVVDIARWERALNGKAIRLVHSINNGNYGGETLFTWDASKKSVVYHYFTTAGFMTVGTLTIQDGKWVTVEKVPGGSGGVTEVRGTSELRKDGTFHVSTEYVDAAGKVSPGREVTYQESPKAEVVFR